MIKSLKEKATQLPCLLATFLAGSKAVSVSQQNTRQYYQSQAQCDQLPSSPDYEYIFNQDACACFLEFDSRFRVNCPSYRPVFNPLHIPGVLDIKNLCLTHSELDLIYQQGTSAGMDCIKGTNDDPHAETEPSITHVSSPDQCGTGFQFDQLLCACRQEQICDFDCPRYFSNWPVLNPLQPCQCIGEENLQSFYDHGLGSNCAPGEPLPQCDQDAIVDFNKYNINKADDLTTTEWQIYHTLEYNGSHERDALFAQCDVDNND